MDRPSSDGRPTSWIPLLKKAHVMNGRDDVCIRSLILNQTPLPKTIRQTVAVCGRCNKLACVIPVHEDLSLAMEKKNSLTLRLLLPTTFIINHILTPCYMLRVSVTTPQPKSPDNVSAIRRHVRIVILFLCRVICNRQCSGTVGRRKCLWSTSRSSRHHNDTNSY